MKKQNIDKKQDAMNNSNIEEGQEQATQQATNDRVTENEESTTDKVSVEPSLEEQIAAWQEKMELVERGCEGAWKAILPIMDDIERAVAASHKSDDIEALRQGEELVMKKFESVLQAAGITAIDCIDKPFNEEEQEAVARFAAGEDKRGLVIDCVQRGYKLGEHVLRYAKVVVGE